MSGRIKLLKDGAPVNVDPDPPIGYDYDSPGKFDETCGTHGLDLFQLPNSQCPPTFVCGADQTSDSVQKFSRCINAMNCHMFAGMTTGVRSGSELALFIHQMIPHHQNAVNMAKALLKTGTIHCDDVTDDENSDCVMEDILRSIINGQNHQIQLMRSVLEEYELPAGDECLLDISTASTNGNGSYSSDSATPVSAPPLPLLVSVLLVATVTGVMTTTAAI